MNSLKILEQKIVSLVTMISELQEQIKKLSADNKKLQEKKLEADAEAKEMKAENAKLAEELAQIEAKLNAVEDTVVYGNDTINELSRERTLTKSMVDDLIASIDSLVSIEKQ